MFPCCKPSQTLPPRLTARERAGLIKQVFQAYDTNGDGKLNARDLLPFGQAMGFDGEEEEWPEAFSHLCGQRRVLPSAGFSLENFTALVSETKSEDDACSACFCSDDHLTLLLRSSEKGSEVRSS